MHKVHVHGPVGGILLDKGMKRLTIPALWLSLRSKVIDAELDIDTFLDA